MAGDDFAWGYATTGGSDEGYVTALDLSGLDLSGTELVVLSACDTGRGEVHKGEGVLGLQRALLSAGAQTLVVSLFAVPSRETALLMAAFYRQRAHGLDTGAALAAAQRSRIAALRKESGAAHPLLWAAFQAVGR